MLYLGKPLKAGQVVSCLVLPGANARSVPVTINPEKVHTALVCINVSVCISVCMSVSVYICLYLFIFVYVLPCLLV